MDIDWGSVISYNRQVDMFINKRPQGRFHVAFTKNGISLRSVMAIKDLKMFHFIFVEYMSLSLQGPHAEITFISRDMERNGEKCRLVFQHELTAVLTAHLLLTVITTIRPDSSCLTQLEQNLLSDTFSGVLQRSTFHNFTSDGENNTPPDSKRKRQEEEPDDLATSKKKCIKSPDAKNKRTRKIRLRRL